MRFDPPPRLHAALFVPDLALRTADMRAVLPAHVTHADATHNVAATALVVAALTGNRPELLGAMGDDRLHEPYRVAHFAQLPELVAAARSAGALGAALSGAGSSILALADSPAVAASCRRGNDECREATRRGGQVDRRQAGRRRRTRRGGGAAAQLSPRAADQPGRRRVTRFSDGWS